jgi:outer membrane protein assembly factor BamB
MPPLSPLSVLLFLSCASGAALAAPPEAHWPQWRGPHRSDVAAETGFLKAWPKDGPKRLWLFSDCGMGYSGPAVVGKTLYTMGARRGKEALIAVEIDRGAEKWGAEIGAVYEHDRGEGPRGTPTVSGERVYGLGGGGDLACVEAASGKLVWRVTMKELGGATPRWGYSESVLVDGQRVICTPGGKEGAVAALDKDSGKVIWQSKGFSDTAHYVSPIAAEVHGVRQYIQLTGQSLVGLRAEDGKLLWRVEWPGQVAVVPTPILHDNHIYVTAGYGVGCKLVKLLPGDKAEEIYSNKEMVNHHGGVILVDGRLYGYSDGKGWVCQDFASGKTLWREKSSLGKGAIGYAEGRFYCLDEDSGAVALIEASPESWKERGRFTLEPQTKQRSPRGKIWTHPVITGGRLYLRDQEILSCYDVAQN